MKATTIASIASIAVIGTVAAGAAAVLLFRRSRPTPPGPGLSVQTPPVIDPAPPAKPAPPRPAPTERPETQSGVDLLKHRVDAALRQIDFPPEPVADASPAREATVAVTEKSGPTARGRFLEVLKKHDIALSPDADSRMSGVGYHDSPVKDRLFAGTDVGGRVFLNIPLRVSVCEGDGLTTYRKTGIVVHQRYSDTEDVFVFGGSVEPLGIYEFFGPDLNDMTMLDRLLSGETIRSHGVTYEGGKQGDDPDYWIEIRLNRAVS